LSCPVTEVPFAATRNSYCNRKSIYQNWTSVSQNKIILDTREHDSVRTCDDWRMCFCTTQFLLPSLLCSVSFVKRTQLFSRFPQEREWVWLANCVGGRNLCCTWTSNYGMCRRFLYYR
jgi:hypothetical protein